jgi:hypothetical protein
MLLEIDDWGRFPGRIKLMGDGLKPNALIWPGDFFPVNSELLMQQMKSIHTEKSSISSFNMIPSAVMT